MVIELKLRKVGNSVGAVLPKKALARARKMKVAQQLSRRYRHALKELAK